MARANFHNDHNERRRIDPRWGRVDTFLRASTNADDADAFRSTHDLRGRAPEYHPRNERALDALPRLAP